jgi:hypothetical protein
MFPSVSCFLGGFVLPETIQIDFNVVPGNRQWPALLLLGHQREVGVVALANVY